MFHFAAKGPQRTADRIATALRQWHDSADNWFDGSIHSADQRLRRCANLLATVRGQLARDPGNARYLAAYRELTADMQAVRELRQDLLSGGLGREAGVSRSAPGRTASKRLPLTDGERRWVELEAARFARDNADVAHDHEELGERARRHADAHLGKLAPERARVVTAAFVDRVIERGRATARPRVAAVAAPRTDFSAELLFLP